jgi:hypothetical protein
MSIDKPSLLQHNPEALGHLVVSHLLAKLLTGTNTIRQGKLSQALSLKESFCMLLVSGALYPEITRPEFDVDHSPPTSAEVNKT